MLFLDYNKQKKWLQGNILTVVHFLCKELFLDFICSLHVKYKKVSLKRNILTVVICI